jgi:hypothetical protein
MRPREIGSHHELILEGLERFQYWSKFKSRSYGLRRELLHDGAVGKVNSAESARRHCCSASERSECRYHGFQKWQAHGRAHGPEHRPA